MDVEERQTIRFTVETGNNCWALFVGWEHRSFSLLQYSELIEFRTIQMQMSVINLLPPYLSDSLQWWLHHRISHNVLVTQSCSKSVTPSHCLVTSWLHNHSHCITVSHPPLPLFVHGPFTHPPATGDSTMSPSTSPSCSLNEWVLSP